MKKHAFRPSLNESLEDRLALSHSGAVGVVVVEHAHPTPATHGHVLKSSVVADVNRKVDAAFAQFNKEYKKEIVRIDRTGDEARFGRDLGVSTAKLKKVLDKQAARIPGGTQTLAPMLNARVDSLVNDLATKTTRSSTDLIQSDRSGAHADVQTYIHDATSRGDFSLR
jgi:hypothetical protein